MRIHKLSYLLILGLILIFSGCGKDEPSADGGITTPETIDWCSVHWPPSTTTNAGVNDNFYVRVKEAGLTGTTYDGSTGEIQVYFGVSTTDTDPASWASGQWVLMDLNSGYAVEDNDNEFYKTTSRPAAGTYYYAAKARLEGGAFTYCGTGGVWSDNNAIWTVNP